MYIIIGIILFYLLLCYFCFVAVCRVNKDRSFKIIDRNIEEMLRPYKDIVDKGVSWVNNQKIKHIYIKSSDGLKLHSIYINHKKEKGTIILVHGYRSTKERDLYTSVYNYYNMGYSLLIPDLRGCGESEGKYITFGYYESQDLDKWVNYAYKHFKTKIILAGISLGASSTLMVNNKHVSLMLTDSPYKNAYKEVSYCIRHFFHIPSFILMPGICLYTRIFAKFALKKCDAIKNIKKLNIPILLVHGLSDDFVPHKNSMDIYNEYNGKKDILLIPNATHGMGYLVDSETYLNKLKEFLKYN